VQLHYFIFEKLIPEKPEHLAKKNYQRVPEEASGKSKRAV